MSFDMACNVPLPHPSPPETSPPGGASVTRTEENSARLDLLRLGPSAALPAEDEYSGDLVHTIVSALPNLSPRHLIPPSSLPPELPFLPPSIRGITEL